jgi:hypothetical protein
VRDVCWDRSNAALVRTPFMDMPHVPWRLRRQLRQLGVHPRAVAESSGIKEWSDGELARLQPWWIKAFLRRHVTRCAFVACLFLVALAFLGASFERYQHWLQTTEAVAGEPVRKVDRWTAYCRVNPWMRTCRPVSRTARGGVTLVVASGTAATLARHGSGPDYAGVQSFE